MRVVDATNLGHISKGFVDDKSGFSMNSKVNNESFLFLIEKEWIFHTMTINFNWYRESRSNFYDLQIHNIIKHNWHNYIIFAIIFSFSNKRIYLHKFEKSVKTHWYTSHSKNSTRLHSLTIVIDEWLVHAITRRQVSRDFPRRAASFHWYRD